MLPKGTVTDFVPLLLRFSLANFSLDGISSVDWSIISKPNFLMILAKNLEKNFFSLPDLFFRKKILLYINIYLKYYKYENNNFSGIS